MENFDRLKSRDRCFPLLRTCFQFRHGNRDFVDLYRVAELEEVFEEWETERGRGGERGVTNNVAV